MKLLQDKLLPLKREKYNHLQKINLALRKDHHFIQSMAAASLAFVSKQVSQAKNKGEPTTRTGKSHFTEDLLLHKLKRTNHLSESTPRLSKRTKIDECLEEVEQKMVDFEKEAEE
jgi:hypothetical protein